MPDQSLDQQTNPTAATPSATPDDTSANHPEAATEASREANVTQASEGQLQQADVTINQDPVIAPGDDNADPAAGASDSGSGDNYDDEDAWPYRALQQEAKHRELDASGKRDEIVARLREADASPKTEDSGSGSASDGTTPTVVGNGGIAQSPRATRHAEILQEISDERRQQQLAGIRERSARTESETVEA